MPVLTAVDVLGIQRFVFLSNRLKDVIAGSWMVHWSTDINGALNGLVEKEQVLVAGGGNLAIEFDSMEKARSFASYYTRRLHDEAPGLQVVIVHRPFEPGNLARTLKLIQIDLAKAKNEYAPSAPLLGISVTASCSESGLPANGFEEGKSNVPLSNKILKRREKISSAVDRWKELLPHSYEDNEEYDFPLEFDQLGRTYGEKSLVGVLHVDGNGIGQKISDWLDEKIEQNEEDSSVRSEYKEISESINNLVWSAFKAAVDRVYCAANQSKNDGNNFVEVAGTPDSLGFKLSRVDNKWMLPLRPILLGGDDITFVCDGRIALDLAETILDKFDKSELSHLGKVSASAGIAIVQSHFPFARAYELAAGLCTSAKRMLKRNGDEGCALDWHIGDSRPGESIENLRERQYKINEYELTCRPYRLGKGKDDAESWRWLSLFLLDDQKFGLRGKVWAEKRNKVKALQEIIREGPDKVESALKSWRIVTKNLEFPVDIKEDGFFDKSRTPLLDAVELLNLHLVLNSNENNRDNEED